jgi:hypothetical protein
MGNRLCAMFLATAMAMGCGTIQVDVVKPYEAHARLAPTQIIVFDFESDAADISLSDEDASKQAAGRAVAKGLSEGLLEELEDLGIPSSRQTGELVVPDGALAIFGRIVKVDEGSSFKRGLVGFGYGSSQVDTVAQLYGSGATSPALLAEYSTHATSGRKPGIATTLPIGVAVQGLSIVVLAISAASVGVGELNASVGRDAARTAEEWAEMLEDLFQQQGWVTD